VHTGTPDAGEQKPRQPAPSLPDSENTWLVLKHPPDGALVQAPQLGQFLRREVPLERVSLLPDWSRKSHLPAGCLHFV
jgi:hypothetical protein